MRRDNGTLPSTCTGGDSRRKVSGFPCGIPKNSEIPQNSAKFRKIPQNSVKIKLTAVFEREFRNSQNSPSLLQLPCKGAQGGPKWGCNNATMGPCAGQLDSSGRAAGQAAMRDRKISIQTIKAAPRSFRLRGRFAPSRALISDIPALRDFCIPP